ncbi:hypothetical protein ACG1VR_10545 [Cedecea davisae]|uniref:hypothetical protein n=1 Tax=Cedecea davisae TaxID=158484 RepID=UPI00376EC42B
MKNIFLISALLLPISSYAAVYGGSNLGYSGYPEFSEIEPSQPYSSDQYAMDSYKREVENYVAKAKQYVEDADSDAKRVRKAQQEAIDKANAVVADYNRKMNSY